jgi:hypothetical protein
MAAAIALFPVSLTAFAHHATAAQYDVSMVIKLKGVITRIEWSNPHAHVYVDVKTEDGGSENWALEFPSPGAIVVAGLSKQLLAPGTILTFEAYPARAAAGAAKPQRSACVKAITLGDGSRVAFVVGI